MSENRVLRWLRRGLIGGLLVLLAVLVLPWPTSSCSREP